MAGRPVYSSLLFAFQGFSSSVVLGPVPPGEVWVLRDLDGYANMSPFETARLYLRGTVGQTIAFMDWPNNSENHQQWVGRQVIPDSHTAQLVVLGGGSVDVTLSGYILTNP